MSEDLLRVEDVRFAYAESGWALGGVSFSAQPGEVLAIIGPNGSGKSTLLRIAAGVLSPTAGRVLLNGNNLTGMDRREVARTMGYLPQQVTPVFDYCVEDVVGMGRFPHLAGMGLLSERDRQVVESSMRQTATLECRDRPLSHLSGGERQRVFLASVLAQEPRLLLLDEPTAALDIHHQARFFRLLRSLSAGGIAVVVVTHDLNLASFYCSRLLLVSAGRAWREGTPDEVIRPEALSEVYGESVAVHRDSRTGKPYVLPLIESASNPEGAA